MDDYDRHSGFSTDNVSDMNNDDRNSDPRDALSPMMSRDGFSPDLPADFATRGDNAGLSWGLKILMYMMSGVKVGTLDIVLPNGSTRRFEGREPGPHGLWQIKSERLMRHLLTGGEVGSSQDFSFLVRRGNGRHYMAWAELYRARFPERDESRRLGVLLPQISEPGWPLLDDYVGGNTTCRVLSSDPA